MDTKLIDELIENHKFLVTIEEGSIGGFASHVLNYIHNIRLKKNSTIIKNIIFPDIFVEHMKPDEQYESINMDTESIVNKIYNLFNDKVVDIKNYETNNKNFII